MEKSEAMEVTKGTDTPASFQTYEGSHLGKALAAGNILYLKGWRLHFLSIRSGPLDLICYAADDPLA